MSESPVDDIFDLLDDVEEVIDKIRFRIAAIQKGEDNGDRPPD